MALNSLAETITATGSPCRVTVCGPSVLASSTTWLNWFFASCRGHVFMHETLQSGFWPVKLESPLSPSARIWFLIRCHPHSRQLRLHILCDIRCPLYQWRRKYAEIKHPRD